jgi:hypothetical protein
MAEPLWESDGSVEAEQAARSRTNKLVVRVAVFMVDLRSRCRVCFRLASAIYKVRAMRILYEKLRMERVEPG